MPKRIDAHFVAAGKYHDIDFARLEVLKLLGEHPEIRTTVAMDFSNTERLEQCQFLVTYTCTVLPTPEEVKQSRHFWTGVGAGWRSMAPIRSCVLSKAASIARKNGTI